MGRRYYCDYCDKTFPDNPINRKNHLRGVTHQVNRQAYNFQFQMNAILVKEFHSVTTYPSELNQTSRCSSTQTLSEAPEIILNMEMEKKPCHAFTSKGSCPFGETCKYSHMTVERKRQLELEVKKRLTIRNGKIPVKRSESEIKVYIDRIESLIKQREILKRKSAANIKELDMTILEPCSDTVYPQCVNDLNVFSIAPSLLIPNPIELSANIDWGSNS